MQMDDAGLKTNYPERPIPGRLSLKRKSNTTVPCRKPRSSQISFASFPGAYKYNESIYTASDGERGSPRNSSQRTWYSIIRTPCKSEYSVSLSHHLTYFIGWGGATSGPPSCTTQFIRHHSFVSPTSSFLDSSFPVVYRRSRISLI